MKMAICVEKAQKMVICVLGESLSRPLAIASAYAKPHPLRPSVPFPS